MKIKKNRIFSNLGGVVRTITFLYISLAGTIFVIAMVALTIDIVLRYGANSSISGLHEAVVIAFVYVVMLGAVALYSKNEDIVVSIFVSKFPNNLQILTGFFVHTIIALTMLIVCHETVLLTSVQMQVPTPQLGWPLGVQWIPLAIASGTIFAFSLLELWAHFLWWKSGSRPFVWQKRQSDNDYF